MVWFEFSKIFKGTFFHRTSPDDCFWSIIFSIIIVKILFHYSKSKISICQVAWEFCGNDSPKTLRKQCASTEFQHQKNYVKLRYFMQWMVGHKAKELFLSAISFFFVLFFWKFIKITHWFNILNINFVISTLICQVNRCYLCCTGNIWVERLLFLTSD